MEISKLVPPHHLLLVLLAFTAGTNMVLKVNAGCGYLSTVGGGCPDVKQCLETCRPCYRGVGQIVAGCVPPSGPILWEECRCYFKKGAPCPPPGPPKCPGSARTYSAFVSTNYTNTLVNETLVYP